MSKTPPLMNHHPGTQRRRSIRLKGDDYSQPGAYFVTMVTQDRSCLFGDVAGGAMRLHDAGRMVQAARDRLPCRFPGIDLDALVVMPNHVHGIIVIVGAVGAPPADAPAPADLVGAPDSAGAPDPVGAPLVGAHDVDARDARATTRVAPTRVAPTLGDVVGAYKSVTTVEYTRAVRALGWPPFRRLWQRNYYERIVWDDASLDRVRRYIRDNPAQWGSDRETPTRRRWPTSTGCAISR